MIWACVKVAKLGKRKNSSNVKTNGKVQSERPKKQWIDLIKQDLEKLRKTYCEKKVNNCEEWKELAVVEKFLKSCDAKEEE